MIGELHPSNHNALYKELVPGDSQRPAALPIPLPPPRMVRRTRSLRTGDQLHLAPDPCSRHLGGVAGADARCTEATQRLSGGAWIAWLSTPTVNAIDRVAEVGPWFDLAGMHLFSDKAQLASTPDTGLWFDQGGIGLGTEAIWTGTGTGGTYSERAALPGERPSEPACRDWTWGFDGQSAVAGSTGFIRGWTQSYNLQCSVHGHLICIEQ